MELEKVLLSRKSTRAYLDKEVEAEKLEKVITSASLAPLGLPKMCTPMLTVVTDKDVLAQLEGYYGAPALIFVSCPPSPAPGIADQNAACVVEMMSLMATDLGLANIYLYGVCARIKDNAEMKKKLGLPENFTPLAALALGYSEEGVAVCKEFAPKLEVKRL